MVTTKLNPIVALSERTESFDEFSKRHLGHKFDPNLVNFKVYQRLFLRLIEDYLYMWDVTDEEFREILRTLVSKSVRGESIGIRKLKRLISHLYKCSDDLGSKKFRISFDNADRYFDEHTHLIH